MVMLVGEWIDRREKPSLLDVEMHSPQASQAVSPYHPCTCKPGSLLIKLLFVVSHFYCKDLSWNIC